jgi:phosphohistidine phosphatase
MPTPELSPVRYLWLLRHGKATPDTPAVGADRLRPLTARGRRDATALGAVLAGPDPLGLVGVVPPATVVCSAAVRTRQTADLVVEGMGIRIPVQAYRSLYAATSDVLLRYVQEIDDTAISALVVGHNPGIAELAWELVEPHDGDRPGSDRAVLEAQGFPTCALAVVTVPAGRWSEIAPASGHLSGLFTPPY